MKVFLIVGIIFSIIGLGFLISSVVTIKEKIQFERFALKTVGTSTDIETREEYDSESRSTIYSDYAILRFSDEKGLPVTVDKL